MQWENKNRELKPPVKINFLPTVNNIPTYEGSLAVVHHILEMLIAVGIVTAIIVNITAAADGAAVGAPASGVTTGSHGQQDSAKH